jgi:phosphoserine phosphatase RsbU/P
LRAYSSHGLTPERTMRAMDRLYLENCTFEQIESFATIFFAMIDPKRRLMQYSCAGHEPVILVHPHEEPKLLPPTAPLIGVFDDQHHLFKQENVELWPGSLLVTSSDGITEARNADGEFYGVERLVDAVRRTRDDTPQAIVDAIVSDAEAFSGQPWRDDVAVLVARFT